MLKPEQSNNKQQGITRLDRWIVSTGRVFSLVFLLCAGIIVYEIVARYVFNAPTFWVHETTILLCAMLFAYGGIYALGKDKHIRIGLLYDLTSPKVQRWLDIFISFMGVLYAGAMSYAAFLVAKSSLFKPWGAFQPETSGSAWDPPLPSIVKTFLFLILFIMLIQFILHLILHIRRKPDV